MAHPRHDVLGGRPAAHSYAAVLREQLVLLLAVAVAVAVAVAGLSRARRERVSGRLCGTDPACESSVQALCGVRWRT